MNQAVLQARNTVGARAKALTTLQNERNLSEASVTDLHRKLSAARQVLAAVDKAVEDAKGAMLEAELEAALSEQED